MAVLQGLLPALLLPPLLLAGLILLCGLLAWRGAAWAGLLAAICALGLFAMATPLVAGLLIASLERGVPMNQPAGDATAIIILGGDVAHGRAGDEPGSLTLERLRAGAALHRATGLPILVTGGVLGPGEPPLATLMARSLKDDFLIPVRWVEPRARDTRDNALLSAAMLRESGMGAALLVTHSWHMARAMEAFGRAGFPVYARPVRIEDRPRGSWSDLAPRPDRMAESWFALREWLGRLVYMLRDDPAEGVSAKFTDPPRPPRNSRQVAGIPVEFRWLTSCFLHTSHSCRKIEDAAA
ncbi:YdcF family protein [Roseococcus pinisoli]|uniref:YdcF family protein n=1 Tax=Roseococcus pinisoli TaxID=2835040 RepID=A0ABS5QEA1_9PROT|nr:YdcF family protein [Roseococcus pinisoli]MBS7812024.1 YdcF family protein [Roseococcus pinisoli]